MCCVCACLPTKPRKEAGAQSSSSSPSHERGSIVACFRFRISQLRSAFTLITPTWLLEPSGVPGTVEFLQGAGGHRIGDRDDPARPGNTTGYRGPDTGDEVTVRLHAINIGRRCGETDHRVAPAQELDRRDDKGIRDHCHGWRDIAIVCTDTDLVEGGRPQVARTKGKTILGANVRSEERRVGKECRSRWSPYH